MGGWSSWARALGTLGLVIGCRSGSFDDKTQAAADAGAGGEQADASDEQADASDEQADARAEQAPATDAAPEAGASVALPLVPTTALAAAPAATIQLAGDARGVAGITASNGVWALGAGEAAPRVLVPDAATPAPWGLEGQLIVAGDDVYWLDRAIGALHHVRRDGGADDALASGLDRPGTLAADDDRVYWSECTFEHEGGGVIRALARGNATGTAPATLVTLQQVEAVQSLAVASGVLYWVQFISIGATVYYSGLVTAPTATLLAGGAGTPNDHASYAYGLTAAGGQVYFGVYHGLSQDTTIVARLYEPGDLLYTLSILPWEAGLTGIAAVGDTLAVTGTQYRGGNMSLYALPVVGAGPILVAQNLKTAAVAGPSGATFVDGAGNLVAIAPAELKAAALSQAP